MTEAIISISQFIHLVASIVWIGGLLIFTVYVWPEVHRSVANPDESRQFVLRLQRRFRPVANLSLVSLLGTGMVQMGANANYEGLLAFTNTWTIAMLFKHLAFGGMVILAFILQLGVAPSIERAALLAARGATDELDRVMHREAFLTRLMLALGAIVLLFTAIATAL